MAVNQECGGIRRSFVRISSSNAMLDEKDAKIVAEAVEEENLFYDVAF